MEGSRIVCRLLTGCYQVLAIKVPSTTGEAVYGLGQMTLARAGRTTNQHGAGVSHEPTGQQIADLRSIEAGRCGEVERLGCLA